MYTNPLYSFIGPSWCLGGFGRKHVGDDGAKGGIVILTLQRDHYIHLADGSVYKLQRDQYI